MIFGLETRLMLNRSPMQMLVRMMITPSQMPWTARAVMSIVMLFEMPQSSDPSENITMAVRNIGRRPQISDSFPHSSVDAALESRYAEPIHVYPADELKCCVIVGSGVVVIVCPSSALIHDAFDKSTHEIERREKQRQLQHRSAMGPNPRTAKHTHSAIMISEICILLRWGFAPPAPAASASPRTVDRSEKLASSRRSSRVSNVANVTVLAMVVVLFASSVWAV